LFFLFPFFYFFPFFFWCSICEPKSMLLYHATDWPEELTWRAHQNRRSCIPGSCTLSILRKWNCSSHWKAGQKAPCYLFWSRLTNVGSLRTICQSHHLRVSLMRWKSYGRELHAYRMTTLSAW
jgi:hypothetical protein